MKKLLLSMAFVCFLSLPALRAQNTGHCSIIMFSEQTEENGKINLLGLFSGFNAKAINRKSIFQTRTVFRSYTPNKEYPYKIVLTNMKDDSVIDSFEGERSFTLKGRSFSRDATMEWAVTFPEAGNYCITVYVDDLVAQKLYFGVGN